MVWSKLDAGILADKVILLLRNSISQQPHNTTQWGFLASTWGQSHTSLSVWGDVISFRMMTSSNENIFRVTGPLCGEFTEFPAQRPVTRSFDIFFDQRLDKRLSKQSWGWWFETLSHPLWRHSNGGSDHRTYINTNCGKCVQTFLEASAK